MSSRGPGSSLGWAQCRQLPALCHWSGACRPPPGSQDSTASPALDSSTLVVVTPGPLSFQPRRFSTTSICSTAPSQSSARGMHARPWPCATRESLPGCGPAPGDSSELWGRGPRSCIPICSDPTRGVCIRSPDGTAYAVMSPCPTGPRAWQKLSRAKRGKGSWPCGSHGDMGH